MTIELWVLVFCSGLALFLSSVVLFRAMRLQWGLSAMLGNREALPPLTGWGGRAVRAYSNLMDNLILYGAVALTAATIGVSNEWTILGAYAFLIGRTLHAVTYIAGVPVARTISYVVGLAGTIMIASQLF